ncbi:glycoside hydrolase family 16 protein [Fibrobacter sp. UWB2]|uniref:glycoside hydrolase family 16 protein n=1 Tax=Fibrobacter sp. UWB2 TaxID=1964358 RepID=UPI001E5C32D3|nr:glycoside hydrolase family 16 protein [Fibrobacter sp. UWB2]
MVYKLIAAVGIVALAACSDDASPSFAGPAECSADSSSSVIPAETSSSFVIPASSGNLLSSSSESVIESSAASSSSMTIESSSSAETASSSSAETTSSSSEEPAAEYFWNDEFDSESIDLNKWTFEIGTGAGGWGNNEWEYYTDRKENAYVKDGVLHIRAQKEDYEGQKYTSARMLTKGKFSFKYGTVEARIALPTGKGIWPAFWMLGENFDTVGWPACGEIDIIEAVNTENKIYGTNHWANGAKYATYGNNTGNYRNQKFDLDITQFHTYKFTWDEKYIRMFVDDFMYHEILIEGNEGDTEEFHKPFFFLLNVAVAGNWPGFEVDDSQFPNEMLVDYIRVIK